MAMAGYVALLRMIYKSEDFLYKTEEEFKADVHTYLRQVLRQNISSEQFNGMYNYILRMSQAERTDYRNLLQDVIRTVSVLQELLRGEEYACADRGERV
jgi:hypothetical protein